MCLFKKKNTNYYQCILCVYGATDFMHCAEILLVSDLYENTGAFREKSVCSNVILWLTTSLYAFKLCCFPIVYTIQKHIEQVSSLIAILPVQSRPDYLPQSG